MDTSNDKLRAIWIQKLLTGTKNHPVEQQAQEIFMITSSRNQNQKWNYIKKKKKRQGRIHYF